MVFYCDRQSNKLVSSITLLAIATGLVVGQSATHQSLAQTSTTPPPAGVTSINGAGASSITTLLIGTGTTYPLAPKDSWFNAYAVGNPPSLNNNVPPALTGFPNGTYGPVNSSITFRYASVGSGTGLTAFFNQTVPPVPPNTATILAPVSFAATDDPVSGTERVVGSPNNVPTPAGTPQNPVPYVQVPVITVGIALAYNPAGLNIPPGGIKLSRATYLGILNGTITNWNAPQIKADNGNVAISSTSKPIVVVRRSDDSGTTFALSSHLKAAFGAAWNRGVGKKSIAQTGGIPNPLPADTVVWPASFQFASGGGGVATKIKATAGAIGYVDSAARLANNLQAAVLKNKAGTYNAISSTSISNAFVGATDQDTNARRIKLVVTDPAAANAYPIVTATYVLFYDKYANVNVANGIKGFINWALGVPPVPASGTDLTIDPNKIAIARGYAPLPDGIKNQARTVVNTYVNTAFNPAP
ncbi:substrate-binding domain-containing protein [Nostoc sp. NMS4]|uniref:substrate-binding domain-containing protein n=1 Tax=Nostoc sp. NMS4 TaxID=2815390 RepID=UPI0025F373E1|nr:substrate-binding domain-containing protein [Nostoc sp. NMS4]MBN3923002.1 substrate-binding domain-containing protein [Nostoc sp. NMS4]